MLILAIDTASPRPGVALVANGAVFEEALPSDRRSSEALLPAIARVLAAAGARLEDCDRVAVCSGPGSFTGIRIGLATAWGFSRAAGLAVEAVSTLECLAETARDAGASSASRVAAVLDAGRGELVVERYDIGGARARPLSQAARVSAGSLLEFTGGDALVELPAGLTGCAALPLRLEPATALALAVARAPGKTSSNPAAASYSRASAAEERRLGPS